MQSATRASSPIPDEVVICFGKASRKTPSIRVGAEAAAASLSNRYTTTRRLTATLGMVSTLIG